MVISASPSATGYREIEIVSRSILTIRSIQEVERENLKNKRKKAWFKSPISGALSRSITAKEEMGKGSWSSDFFWQKQSLSLGISGSPGMRWSFRVRLLRLLT